MSEQQKRNLLDALSIMAGNAAAQQRFEGMVAGFTAGYEAAKAENREGNGNNGKTDE